jgi:hypothetical protein
MKRILAYIVIAATVAALAAPEASAMGISARRKEVPVPTLLPVQLPDPLIKFSSPVDQLVMRLKGTSILLDTAVAKNRVFNYRMNLDCDTYTAHRDLLYKNVQYNVNRFIWSNTFGFALWRSRLVRLWAGPQVALSYEFSNKDRRVLGTYIYNRAGGVIGVNIHTGESTTMSFEIGFRAGFGYDLNKSVFNTITLSRPEPTAAIKLIFRAWDTYVPSGA